MGKTPGAIVPSSYSSTEELKKDLKRRDTEAGFTPLAASSFVDTFFAHFGIKGMHWGVTRSQSSGAAKVQVTTKPGKGVKATGGQGQSANKDAIRKAKQRQSAKKSTTDSLSNQQLQELVKRMQLEQQYDQLAKKEPTKFRKGKDTVDTVLSVFNTAQQIFNAVNSPLGKQIRKTISEAVKSA